jgi:spore coat polysaccharide biosynthesis predicted glycosyltransferase SpsG
MNILVRLNITKLIGTGHFRRMLNLINFMSSHQFVFIVHTDDISNTIFEGKNIIFINVEEEFFKLLKETKYDMIIVDFLRYEKNYIKNIKSIVSNPIISFHEYKDYDQYSDLVVNYNMFNGYDNIVNKKYLFGPEYIIFDDGIEKYQNNKKENFIFVSFGGSDPSGLTQKFIDEIALKRDDLKFKIHVGNFNNININKNENIEYLINPKDIFIYMSSARFAITAGGNMMYELIYFNIPCIVIAHNKHQEEFALNAQKNEWIKYLGKAIDYNSDKLIKEIVSLFSENQKIISTINNNGKKKIANAIERLVS